MVRVRVRVEVRVGLAAEDGLLAHARLPRGRLLVALLVRVRVRARVRDRVRCWG